MKIRIEVTVDVDPVAWAREYGVEGADAIRTDVKRYCEATIVEQLGLVGVLAE